MQNIDKMTQLSEPNSTSSNDPTITPEEMRRILTILLIFSRYARSFLGNSILRSEAMIAYAGDEFLENVVSTTHPHPTDGQPQQRIKNKAS
jgi:hypothetical protein